MAVYWSVEDYVHTVCPCFGFFTGFEPKEMQGRMSALPERLGSCSKAVVLLGNITPFIMNFLVGVWTRW